MITITKKITDMMKYGVGGDTRWCGDVIVDNGQSIQVHGKYFPTRKEAVAYTQRIYKTIIGIQNAQS